MTIPRVFQSSFYYNEEKGVTDVANIITSLEAILLAQTPVWTKLSAGVYKSPVDSAGRFMKLTFVATTSARLRLTVADQNGLTVSDREMQIDTTGTAINYFTGQYYVYLESLRPTTPEWCGAFILDPYSYDLSSILNYVAGGGYRSNAGTADAQGNTIDSLFMIESGVGTERQRCRGWHFDVGGNPVGMLDYEGNPQVFPFDVENLPNGTRLWQGQMPQAYITTSNVAAQTRKPIAIDDATAATFKVVATASIVASMRGMFRVA